MEVGSRNSSSSEATPALDPCGDHHRLEWQRLEERRVTLRRNYKFNYLLLIKCVNYKILQLYCAGGQSKLLPSPDKCPTAHCSALTFNTTPKILIDHA